MTSRAFASSKLKCITEKARDTYHIRTALAYAWLGKGTTLEAIVKERPNYDRKKTQVN